MKIYKVGIVGCGSIFPMHVYPLQSLPNVTIAAVCDSNPERAADKAQQFDCTGYTDYKEMLDKEQLDAVHICTPHYLHPLIAIYAAEKKVHVLTEKPMAIHLADAEAMIQAHEKAGTTLGVIFQNRYNASSVLVKKTLDSGELGAIKSGKLSVTWFRDNAYYTESGWRGTLDKEGGGVVINQSIHTFDLMNWFVNSEIEYVDANLANRAHEPIEVEDVAEGMIYYKNGVIIGFLAMTYYSYDAPVEIELHCEKGIVKMVGDRAVIKFFDGREYIADINPNELVSYGESAKGYWGVNHVKQITNFYDALDKGEQPDITGAAAYKTQKLVTTIYSAGKEKKRVFA